MVRFKKRYLVVEVVPEQRAKSFRFMGLRAAMVDAIKKIHGDFGVAATTPGFSVKYHNQGTLVAFISVGRGAHRLVLSALPFITHMGKQPVKILSLHIAASMRQGFIFLQKYHEKKLKEMEEKLNPTQMKQWQQTKKAALR